MTTTIDPRLGFANPLVVDSLMPLNETASIDERSFEQAIWSGSKICGSAESLSARSFPSLSSDSATLVDSTSDDDAGLLEKRDMSLDRAEFPSLYTTSDKLSTDKKNICCPLTTIGDGSAAKKASSSEKSAIAGSTGMQTAPATSESELVHIAIYSTERCLKVQNGDEDDEDWMPHFNFSYTVVADDDMSLVVYLNDDNISDLVDAEHGTATTLFKSEGDPENKKRDYTFRIVIDPGIEESERTFNGTWYDHKGEWEWRGRCFLEGKGSRVKPCGIEYGPDGKSTIQQLLMLSSVNQEGKDIAQQEGDRIFGKILLDSIPYDVKEKLYPDLPKLDKEERAIKNLGPDYLPRAAVVNLLSHLQGSKDVTAAQRAKIDKNKCEAFFSACMSTTKPIGDQDDPVKTFGWDRERDVAIISRVQQQSRTIASHCYRLSYIRTVTSFQMFLSDPDYWYQRMASYLESPAHLRRFSHRVRSQDSHLKRDVYNWYNKLTLLHNACGDHDGAATIENIMASLQGASTLATLHDVEYNDDFVSHLKQFFEELDQTNNDPLKSQDEDYANLQQLMAIRGANSWSELGKMIISTINAHTNHLHRKPTIAEVANLLTRQETAGAFAGNPWISTDLKIHIRPAIIGGGIFMIINTLMRQRDSLSMPEKITMYLSLVQGIMMEPSVVLTPVRGVALGLEYLARGVGWCLKKIMPHKSLSYIEAACFFLSCFCVWAARDEFFYAKKHGQIVDQWFAGGQLLITALSCFTMGIQLGAAWCFGKAAAPIVAFCGTAGVVLMGIGLAVAVAAVAVGLILKEDPMLAICPYVYKSGLILDSNNLRLYFYREAYRIKAGNETRVVAEMCN
ncbi:hypothetical protein CPB83DRAFT_937189 [Crepidotus variabilis]|uniref:Uncharacterized protein n=1 Tax=Crepidotus variabilis TaxID=179855 RepID=A0A9P6ECY8_9AGAR|nr:hypothetical protein CPB83DRAFT_937189 [Crepidotus variabilis]